VALAVGDIDWRMWNKLTYYIGTGGETGTGEIRIRMMSLP